MIVSLIFRIPARQNTAQPFRNAGMADQARLSLAAQKYTKLGGGYQLLF
jgi:hypothetical protein